MNSKKTSNEKLSTAGAEKPTQNCLKGNSKSSLKNISKQNCCDKKVPQDKDCRSKSNSTGKIEKTHTDIRSKVDKIHNSHDSVHSQDARKSSVNKPDNLSHTTSVSRRNSSEFDELASEARRRFQFGIDIMARNIWYKYNTSSLGHTSSFTHEQSTSKLCKSTGNVEGWFI